MIDPAAVLGQLTSEEKIALLSGDDMWHTAAVPRLNIPRVRTSDGPNGVRGTSWNGPAASCFPCSTALGASFDQDLARRIGQALGRECRARGVHCLLGPTTNIQRHPYGGRGFESIGEDPFLSGSMAKAWIEGVQSEKVMTTPKHLVGNEQEYLRRSNNSVIDLRTLHEIYLEPFRIQLQANPSVVMASYNRVNGIHVAEDCFLLREVLREEFGFEGLLMSDWSGTISGAMGIKAGLDLEMPGPALVRGTSVERDIVTGKLVPGDVDECVLRVLSFVREAQESGIPFEAPDGSADSPDTRALLREAASAAIVLLKNEKSLLPLRPVAGQRIAVIGHNAKYPSISGGGSAALRPTYITTPLEAITAAAEELRCSVNYAQGVDGSRFLPLLTPHLSVTEDGPMGQVNCSFYDQDPWATGAADLFSKNYQTSFCFFHDGVPKEVPVRGYVSLRAFFRPDTTGLWELGLGVNGQADLYIDGEMVIQNSTDQKVGLLFFNTGTEEKTCQMHVEANRVYELEVRFSNFKQLNAMSPYSGRRGGIRVGGRFVRAQEEIITEAVECAQNADIVVIVVGTTPEWESEAYDRNDYHLPPGTDELIERVLAVCPKTVIVNQSGMPVALPWLSKAPALLQAWFGGNDNGGAIADVLFGKCSPSGKLPVTWARQAEDWPSHAGFGHPTDTVYSEGIKVGYRYFDRPGAPESLFPFGWGVSYTTFAFSDLSVTMSDCEAVFEFNLTNSGSRAGAEVAQVYIHSQNSPVERPEAELCAFRKVDLQPGESQPVRIVLDHTAFSFYDTVTKRWMAVAGDYEVRVGSSSRHVAFAKPVHLAKTWTWKGLERPTPL